jgi:phenylpyruvate tautomerase PptA (4-oxalocrotonate tautomerase family)
MPLIQISLQEGKSPEYIKAIGAGVHEALRSAWKIPENDHFQIITEHKKSHFIINKKMWDVDRSDDVVVIYITSITRTSEMKTDLYKELVNILGQHPKVRKEDIFVTIVHNNREDWSFGNGVAQMMPE